MMKCVSRIPTRMLAGLALAVATIAAGHGCSSTSPGGMPVSIADIRGDWILTRISGKPIQPPASGRLPSLKLESDGKVSGFAGVNRLASSVDVAGLARGEFKLKPAAVTKMAGPPDAMKIENDYLAALNKVTTSKMDASELSLGDGAGELLRFSRPR